MKIYRFAYLFLLLISTAEKSSAFETTVDLDEEKRQQMASLLEQQKAETALLTQAVELLKIIQKQQAALLEIQARQLNIQAQNTQKQNAAEKEKPTSSDLTR